MEKTINNNKIIVYDLDETLFKGTQLTKILLKQVKPGQIVAI